MCLKLETGMQDIASFPVALDQGRNTRVWQVAQDLEANFLSEMLKATGFDGDRKSFGGGIGESQFASFSREAHAGHLVAAGGIGLSKVLYASMMEMRNE